MTIPPSAYLPNDLPAGWVVAHLHLAHENDWEPLWALTRDWVNPGWLPRRLRDDPQIKELTANIHRFNQQHPLPIGLKVVDL